MSIGAGRGRLIQQTLIESALLSLASCALGAGRSIATPHVVSMLSALPVPSCVSICKLDWRLLLFLTIAGSLVTFLFGARLRFTRQPCHQMGIEIGQRKAHGEGRSVPASRRRADRIQLRRAVRCRLSLTSFVKLLRTDLGFDREQRAIVNVQANRQAERTSTALATWDSHVGTRSHTSPGVESASLSRLEPVRRFRTQQERANPGPGDRWLHPWYLQVSPGFLADDAHLAWSPGRDLEWRDAHPELPSAVIVNESFARRYFPSANQHSVKRFFRVDGGASWSHRKWSASPADAKYTDLREAAPPTVYDPFRPEGWWPRFRCGRDSKWAPCLPCFGTSCRERIRLSACRSDPAIHSRR